jgi:hypothetical protein
MREKKALHGGNGASKVDRTSAVLSFLRCNLSPPKSLPDLLNDYRCASPFPHLVLDNLFPSEELELLKSEIPSGSSENWVNEKNDRFIKSNLRSAVYLGAHGYSFTSMLHSAAFLYFLTEMTGVGALLPDPYLSGGGYHLMQEGGKFEVHADTNTDSYCGLHRRLAMLIYLNKGWKSEYGGQLELWNQSATQCEKAIEPIFNRTVIFEISDVNFHAVRPVAAGFGARRELFAAYFHTVSQNLVPHNSIYAPSIYRDIDTPMRRVMRQTMPPFLWGALKRLKHLKKDRRALSHERPVKLSI